MKRVLILTVIVLGAAVCGSAQARPAVECFDACAIVHSRPAPPHLPEPGPCFYHGGVAWVIPGFTEEGEYVLYYGCLDGSVITVGA